VVSWGFNQGRKIAIENLAILQTGDLPAILRCRRIFALHRILPLSPCGDRFQICPQKRGIKGEGSSQKWLPPRLAAPDRINRGQFPQKSKSIFGNKEIYLMRLYFLGEIIGNLNKEL